VNKDVIWVGTDDGRLHITQDRGKTWTAIYKNMRKAPIHTYVPQIEVSTTNAGEAFVVVNNYRNNDYKAYLYHTKNYGKTFDRIMDEGDVSSFVKSVVQDPVEQKLLFAGTDVGLYFSLDYGNSWQRFRGEDFPHVMVSDLKIHPREHDLVIGTFGRAFWILDDIRPLRALASKGTSMLRDSLVVFEPAPAVKASMRSYDGIRFNAQGEWVGDNKRVSSSRIRVYTPMSVDKDKKTKLKIQIVDAAGDTIRTFHQEVKGGLESVRWGGSIDGEKKPDAKEDDDAPGILSSLPGTYTAIVSYGNHSASTSLELKADPRRDISLADMKASLEKTKEIQGTRDRLTRVNYNMKQMRKSMKNVGTLLESLPDSTQTEIRI